MEQVISGTDDHLLHMLDYKLSSNSASYVSSRREVSFFPAGGDSYGPAAVRTLRFQLAGSGWIDLSSLYISMKVHNLDTTNVLRPLTPGCHCLFDRARFLCSGVVCEDIQGYNRVHEMLENLLPPQKRENIAGCMGFGVQSGGFQTGNTVASDIVASGSKVCCWQPSALGLISQSKWIPLWCLGSGGHLEALGRDELHALALDPLKDLREDRSP